MKEPEEYSTEISDICKSVISNSHHNQNVKSDFGKVGQRNIEKKNSNNNIKLYLIHLSKFFLE